MTNAAPPPGVAPLLAARSRTRAAVRAPVLQPRQPVAHGRLRDEVVHALGRLSSTPGARPTGLAHERSAPFKALQWSPFWSPLFWRAPTFGVSRWRIGDRVEASKALLLTRFDSL